MATYRLVRSFFPFGGLGLCLQDQILIQFDYVLNIYFVPNNLVMGQCYFRRHRSWYKQNVECWLNLEIRILNWFRFPFFFFVYIGLRFYYLIVFITIISCSLCKFVFCFIIIKWICIIIGSVLLIMLLLLKFINIFGLYIFIYLVAVDDCRFTKELSGFN